MAFDNNTEILFFSKEIFEELWNLQHLNKQKKIIYLNLLSNRII